jgi:hypothetical protein
MTFVGGGRHGPGAFPARSPKPAPFVVTFPDRLE